MNPVRFSLLLIACELASSCAGTPRQLMQNTLTEACRQQCWSGKAQAATLSECLKKCDAP